MSAFDEAFLNKALEKGFITQTQAPRFWELYHHNPEGTQNFAQFLVKYLIMTSQEAEEILALLRMESQFQSRVTSHPQFIGKYKILKLLGEGAMGRVYLGQDTDTGRKIALKVIAEQSSTNKEMVQRFIREIEVTMKLRHPNIVQTLDFGIDKNSEIFFAVQEFVDGKTLDEFLLIKKRFSENEAVNIIGQVAQGLAYANSYHIVHRDLKPANLMVNTQGIIKIADFGLAKDKTLESITQTGCILGTPAYMSPEQARGEMVNDIRSDIYSLGIVFFELLTGEVPFKDSSPLRVCLMHASLPLPPLKNYLPRCRSEIEAFLNKMTEKEIAHRPMPEAVVQWVKGLLPKL